MILNSTMVLPAPLGKLLSPQHGIWQNAEATDYDFTQDLSFNQLAGKVNVYLDDRLVPHVFAEQENDAWFVEGYLHARFRLWQMEFQVYAASGRLSELVGDRALPLDRDKRRLGMVYAAERSLAELEKDPFLKTQCDSYTAGINAYIETLNESSMPLEYKLLGYKPEKWTNLKSALFLKYMALDLAGHDDDFELTNAKSVFDHPTFEKVYPFFKDSTVPVIPRDTGYKKPGIIVRAPATFDSLYSEQSAPNNIGEIKPDKDNGSNNWAVSGSKTASGSPILCNDPHLGLNLPAIWYEIQISTPAFNVYGVSFPGAPSVIIGFNDSCAFGFTNGGRDVRDYYEIKFKDDSRKEYWFNNEWKKSDWRVDTIKIKGKPDYIDSVAYTVFGPVMYDKSYSGNRNTNNKYYAVRWKAHDPSNELKVFNMLDRAKNYGDYLEAIKNLHTPGQNAIFACKNGDIALWAQGEFPAKWKRQGDFVMPGTDSSYMWQGNIPQEENPHQYNPDRGFVSSANQDPADSTYPYYLGYGYPLQRGITVNHRLAGMTGITVDDMKTLQTDNYNELAGEALPLMLKYIDPAALSVSDKRYFDLLKGWNMRNEINSTGATVFFQAWDSLQAAVWNDDLHQNTLKLRWPDVDVLVQGLRQDSTFVFFDNINTPQRETSSDIATASFKHACTALLKIDSSGSLEWGKFKNTKVLHLARLEPLSRLHLPIGGGNYVINATKGQHGPSWRMIVSLTPQTEAFAVYPGGESGNPGSKYYDNFVDTWVEGKYYPLWVMKSSEEKDKRVKAVMRFKK